MTNQVPGLLTFYFGNAVLLTVVISFILLAWYRRAVARSMRVGTGPSESGDPPEASDVPVPLRAPARPIAHPDGWVDDTAKRLGRRLQTRLVVIYGAAGIVAAAASTLFFLRGLGNEWFWLQAFVIWYAYCWPILLTLAALLAIAQRRALLAFGGYVLIGTIIILVWSTYSYMVLDRVEVSPIGNVQAFLTFLAHQAWLPFLIIVITGNRRLRSVSPFVLAGLLIFSFSNLVISNGLVTALDYQIFRDHFTQFDVIWMRALWFMIAALPVGYLCWRGLRWLSRYFEQKAFSDTQLLVDSWWLIVVLSQTVGFASDFGWGGLAGLLAFVAYRLLVAAGLALWRTDGLLRAGPRLLLLRVFGFQRRTEKLFDVIAQRWRLLGGVRLIAGADLAMRTMDPADFISFVGGRLPRLFVRSGRDLEHRVEQLDERRDPDGRLRISKFFCHEDTWRVTLKGLLRRSDVVLMDLRGFSASNSGCLFELRQLAESSLLPRTVFVIDQTTDVSLLESTVAEQARDGGARDEPGAFPLNLETMASRSAKELERIYGRLRALALAHPAGQALHHDLPVTLTQARRSAATTA